MLIIRKPLNLDIDEITFTDDHEANLSRKLAEIQDEKKQLLEKLSKLEEMEGDVIWTLLQKLKTNK